jgi:hypothetical protein
VLEDPKNRNQIVVTPMSRKKRYSCRCAMETNMCSWLAALPMGVTVEGPPKRHRQSDPDHPFYTVDHGKQFAGSEKFFLMPLPLPSHSHILRFT